MFVPPSDSRGLRGKIDLLIGTLGEDAELTINHEAVTVTYLSDTKFGATKQQGKSLATDRPRADGIILTESDAQPVSVLLSVAQVQKSPEPHLLFYGSRKSHQAISVLQEFRHTFIYFS